MPELAGLFTTTADNYLYPYTRYSQGHSMDFVLRPGEKLIRFFSPEEPGLFYLPYKFDGKHWTEFPQELPEFHIRTPDGPRSQKDGRLWATGRIEYTPPSIRDEAVTIIDMPSPYVIIDAQITSAVDLPSANSSLRVETSTNGGRNWIFAGERNGPYHGIWTTEPAVLAKSAHGRFTAVSGSYGYKVRITKSGTAPPLITSLHLVSRIQLNPRTLPAVQTGENQFIYSAAAPIRRIAIPVPLAESAGENFELVSQSGQDFLCPSANKSGEIVYALDADGSPLTGFDAGARFLDLRDGLAPDKLTAETRHTGIASAAGDASLAWSVSPNGPFHRLWHYSEKLAWRDGDPIEQLLLWPEVFQQVRDLPPGTKRVYVKFRSSGPALDNIRLAVYAEAPPPKGLVRLTQVWLEEGARREHVQEIEATTREHEFTIRAGSDVQNQAVILSAE